MKKTKEKKHITTGKKCWCDPVVENYTKSRTKPQEIGYASVSLSQELLLEKNLLPKDSFIIGASWNPRYRAMEIYVAGKAGNDLYVCGEGEVPRRIVVF